MFKSLHIPPQVTIKAEVDELDIGDSELDPNTEKVIQKRVKAILNYYQGLFMKVYDFLSTLTNVTVFMFI